MKKGMKGQGDGEFGQSGQGPRDDGSCLSGRPRAGELGCHGAGKFRLDPFLAKWEGIDPAQPEGEY